MRPFKFNPILKQVLWGGDLIKSFKHIDSPLTNIGESWEISGVRGCETAVSDGDDAGLKLSELVQKYGADLVGKQVYEKFGNEFPILIKLIDAHRDLSVQVHPDDAIARVKHGCMGKTEMWYVIKSEPEAKIYAGLSKRMDPDHLRQLIAEKTVMDAVATHESEPGDVFFLPPGRVHSIGAGNLLAEIQQTSNITYRLYDFDRRDANGNLRPLHIDDALDAIDYKVHRNYRVKYDKQKDGEALLAKCKHFTVRRLKLDGNAQLHHNSRSFTVAMCLEGECSLHSDDHITPLSKGDTVLVPACAKHVAAEGCATLLLARM